jgi:hypothetical protein
MTTMLRMITPITGRLTPHPAELAWASLELAALEYRARRGEIILLYEDETILWRLALLRLGWWHDTQRSHRGAELGTYPTGTAYACQEDSQAGMSQFEEHKKSS